MHNFRCRPLLNTQDQRHQLLHSMRRRQHQHPATTPLRQWQRMQPYHQGHLLQPQDRRQDFKERGEDAKDVRDAKDEGEETISGLQHLEGSLQRSKDNPINKGDKLRAGMSRHIVSTITTGTCVFSCGFDIPTWHTSKTCPAICRGPSHQEGCDRQNYQQSRAQGHKVNMNKAHKNILPTNPHEGQA